MNRIRLLSEQVANQIAAGEVVERPASVVKELVENALDAQPTRITVEIQAGGRSLIRVTDDGVGMSRDDSLLCLERHATSKILRAEDLSTISTMGFRGEALPSIASVSRMGITTRERDSQSPAATQIIIHGGKLLEVKEAGAPSGTCVEVRQLFFNLPARRKFLRSEETESAHIHHYLTLAALAHPHLAFTFIKDTRCVWQLPAVPTGKRPDGQLTALRERLESLFGNEQRLLALDFTAEMSSPSTGGDQSDSVEPPVSALHLWGFIGQPGVSRSTRQDQHLFVNRRPVENRGLNFALLEGYHTALMKGRYPVCCLFLEIDPSTVDVNIHPAKREVKFHDERLVRSLTAQAVREALLRFHAPSDPQAGRPKPPPKLASAESLPVTPSSVPEPRTIEFPALRAMIAAPPVTEWSRSVPKLPAVPSTAAVGSVPVHVPAALPKINRVDSVPEATGPEPSSAPVLGDPTPLLNIPLRLIGVIGQLYVVLESDRGLVLMDQHAAHERILFEQMLERVERETVPSQRLLLPETVEVSVRDAQFLGAQLPTLTRLGVGLSEFGERTFLLDSLPPMVKTSDPRRFVLELIDELKAVGQQMNAQRLGEQTIIKTVCRHAVKANDPLDGPELENLVNDLRQCAMPYTCPHGRPTLIEMSYRELERKFGRLA